MKFKDYNYSFLIFIIVINTLSVSANEPSGDSWLCKEKLSTGFLYKDGEWQRVGFSPNGEYIIRPLSREEIEDTFFQILWPDSNYGVYRSGSTSARFGCTESFSDVGYLYCESHNRYFSFNKFNLRFVTSENGDYVSVVPGLNDLTDLGGNTPFVSIGVCQKL